MISMLVGGILLVYWFFQADPSISDIESEVRESESEQMVEIHPSGLVDADGITEVINNCTQCHSTEIIKQNRLSAEQWRSTIKWMQETQNLWDLGNNEDIIIDYLVKNYPPVKKGRRAKLTDIEWYNLEP